MKQKLLLFSFTLISTILFSQAQNMAFEDWKSNDGTQNFFYRNITRADVWENIYIAGATVNSSGTTDILVVKKSSTGVTLWTRTYNGTANFHDFATDMQVTSGGDVYITGAVTNNTVNLTQDLVVIKYNSSGTQQWISTYDGGVNNSDVGRAIVLDGSGNSFITGATYNASGNTDFLTLRYNNSGAQQWVQTYNYSSNLNDAAVKVAYTTNTITITGAVTSTVNNYKPVTIKYATSTGSLLSTNVSTATSTSSVEIVSDMFVDGAGNTYICGALQVAGQGYNYYVAKLTSSLTIAWQQTYNGASNLNDQAKSIKVFGGNVYVSGFSTSSTQGRNIVTHKYNSGGTLQWTQTYNSSVNGNDEPAAMEIDASGNIYVTGTSGSSINNLDYYTVKYNSSGTKIWDVQSDGNHLNDQATNIALDSINNVIVTGSSETAPNSYVYTTIKYVQKDVITPTDFNGESPKNNFMFYSNKGQILDTAHNVVSMIKFYTNYTYPTFYFKDHSQSFVFTKIDTAKVNHKDTLQKIDLTFTNANENSKTYPVEEQRTGYLNYFLTHTGSGGITGVFGNKRLVTSNLYNNIDLMCSSNQNGIKYYFIVKPGADMRDIKLQFTGATSFSLNGTTNALSINSKIGRITFDKPVAYQLTAGNATVAVTSFSPTWTTDGASDKYKFNNGTYTSSLTLVIEVDQGNTVFSSSSTDNLKWSTYLGKPSADMLNKVRTDNAHNLFALGESYSSVFPQGTGINTIYQSANAGSVDGFVCKFSSAGELIWSTFVGGTQKDNLTDVAFHSNGDLYCVGNTNSNDLIPKNKLGADNDATFSGPATSDLYNSSGEAYIFQLDQSGLNNPWLRYYGGNHHDNLTSCVMDANNNFFIAGYSRSSDIPVITPAGSYAQTNPSVSPYFNASDGIVAKFNSSSVITWQTYIGSKVAVTNGPNDYIYDIALRNGDDGGPQDIYIGGYANSSDYPVVYTGSESHYTGTYDNGVISRFTNNGVLSWSTYLVGSAYEAITALAYGSNGLYATGFSSSTDFLSINSTHDYFQLSNSGGNSDAIFVKVNNNNVITHSTYIGGSNNEKGLDIVMDYVNNAAYISGISNSTNFPIPSGNPLNTYNQSYASTFENDNFIAALKDNQTSILWATYLGGSDDECTYNIGNGGIHQSICIDGSNLYLGSLTRSSETLTHPFPLNDNGGTPTYFQPLISGPMDATITKFDLVPVNIVGIQEHKFSTNSIFIYPNPSSDNLFIKFNDKIESTTYKIINSLGQEVAFGNLNLNKCSINIANLSAGFYVIELINNNSKFSAKFVKND